MNFLIVLTIFAGVAYCENAPEILTAIGENVNDGAAAEYRFLFKTITKVVTSTATSTTTSSKWNSCYTSAGVLATCATKKKRSLLVSDKPIWTRNGRVIDGELIRPSKASEDEIPEGRINADSDEFVGDDSEEKDDDSEVTGYGSKNLAEGRLNFFKVLSTSTSLVTSVITSTTTMAQTAKFTVAVCMPANIGNMGFAGICA